MARTTTFNVQVAAAPTGVLSVQSFEQGGLDNFIAYPGDIASTDTRYLWISGYVTVDGTFMIAGDDHHVFGPRVPITAPGRDNSVREYDPNTSLQITPHAYPDNGQRWTWERHNNHVSWYIPHFVYQGDVYDGYCRPLLGTGGFFARKKNGVPFNQWLIHNKLNQSGTNTIGRVLDSSNRPENLFYDDSGVYALSVFANGAQYNSHQAWSDVHNCGVSIAGAAGGDSGFGTNASFMWIVPSAGLSPTRPNPFTVFRRGAWINTNSGVQPPVIIAKTAGRDGCCFVGNKLFWIGGSFDNYQTTPVDGLFYCMNDIRPHLTSKTAPMNIERLPDHPAGGLRHPLLKYDPINNCLLCWSMYGLHAWDLTNSIWVDLTAQAAALGYNTSLWGGLGMPQHCIGGFVTTRGATTHNKFVFRPGTGVGWTNTTQNHRRFFSIKLTRT